jgi:hypothetical protein
MTAEEFKHLLREKTAEEIVEGYLLSNDTGPHTSRDALNELEERARLVFDLKADQTLTTIVVGSAKLGFAYLDKPAKADGSGYKPAYRSYEPGVSDIDVAVVSPMLYGRIWQDLARFGAQQIKFPWRSDVAAYMLHGWLRPDKFPSAAPQRCNDWKNVVYAVSRTQHFKYKRLRCGIYHSRFFLKLYQQRGVIAAQQAEGLI